jgi:hypothetical protein
MDTFISPEMRVSVFACGSQVTHFPLLIQKERKLVPLDEVSVSEVGQVKVFIKRWYGWHKLHLPIELEQVITQFLNYYHNELHEGFDCYSFVTLAASLPIHEKLFLKAFWKTEHIPPDRVAGYRIIFLVNENDHHFAHAAIHIGQGYFLSVQGAGGRLSVSRLSDLQTQYCDCPDLLVATPRDKNEVQEALAMVASA